MTDYYVRTTGDDAAAGTTPATAWATLAHAMDTIAAGDTVYIGPGRYYQESITKSGYGGASGSPKVFQGDPYGEHTGDAPGPVIFHRTAELDEASSDYHFHFTGDAQFLEFHDLVFESGGGTGGEVLQFGEGSASAWDFDGVVVEDCIFVGKTGNSGASEGNAILVDYGEGGAPSGTGLRIRRCLFNGFGIYISTDANAVADYDVDLLIESCVFLGNGGIVLYGENNTYGAVGFKVRDCTFAYTTASFNAVACTYLRGSADDDEISNCVVIGAGKLLSLTLSTDGVFAINHSFVNDEDAFWFGSVSSLGFGMINESSFNPGAYWGYEANYIYEKWFGIRPFNSWEPIEFYGKLNLAIGGGDPTITPSADFYGRPFSANMCGSIWPCGFYNGDYDSAPYNSPALATYTDPDSAWGNDERISHNADYATYGSTPGSASANYLKYENPWINLRPTQEIQEVWVRPLLDGNNDTVELHMQFYTDSEAEDLGELYWTDINTKGWHELKKIPNAPAAGWSVTDLKALETKFWTEETGQVDIYRVVFYIGTANSPDIGAVSSSGKRSIETTIVDTGSNSLKIERAGHYQSSVPVVADTEITISVKSYVDANYDGDLPQLQVYNIPGGTAEQTDTHTAADEVWDTLSVTFTPTKTGFATVRLVSRDESADGATYFDNLTWK